MQALDVQPTNSTPYTPAGGTYNNNPQLGASGLPALSGLTTNMNPMARELQNMGRGEDKMLVHMTPDEVNSLQGLALHTGTTMTINPNTGLPEAGLLGKIFKKLLPALVGGGLMFIPGVNALAAAGIVGGGSTLLTGSLKKGLMAGLSAYGGASLARGLGAGVASSVAPTAAAGAEAGSLAGQGLASLNSNLAGITAQAGQTAAASGLSTGAFSAANPGLLARATQAAQAGLKPGSMFAKAAPYAAGLGLVNTASQVDKTIQQNKKGGPETTSTWVDEGPYMPVPRVLKPRLTGPEGRGEIDYFSEPQFGGYMTASGQVRGLPAGYTQPQYPGYAEGGDTKTDKNYYGDNLTSVGQKDWANAYHDFQKTLMSAAPQETRWNLEKQVMSEFEKRPFKDAAEWSSYLNSVANSALRPAQDTVTKVTDTESPRRDTQTVQAATAGPSGFGVETLKEVYTPQFTKVDDYVTEKVAPYTIGTEMAQRLPEFTNQYRTSPGAITASLGYAPGQSPSQRNRAYALELAKKAEEEEAKRRAAAGAYNPMTAGYFDPMTGQFVTGYAKGGIHMDDGAFVVDARTVSELGNGSSSAGQELLARLGGHPVKGPGDGVSDSIPANIGGTQKARVARDEVIFPAAAVKRVGGAKKLYALMDKAHKARKKADRGEDTKLRKGLGAL